MEFLYFGVLAATLTNIPSLGSGGGDLAHNFHMDEYNSSFDLSDYLRTADVDPPETPAQPELPASVPMVPSYSVKNLLPTALTESNIRDALPPLPRMEGCSRIAFKTQTDEENLDDGSKWRKYGMKSVKNIPNPRNYYRCSTEGCLVKKRVERDSEDPSYVITAYEGIHNHSSPGVVYYATQDSVSGRFHLSGSQVQGPCSSNRV